MKKIAKFRPFMNPFFIRESAQYHEREKIWQQIEELARKKNPEFEKLITQMDYMTLSDGYLNNNGKDNDYTNEDDLSSEKIDQYSNDVSQLFQSLI
jgi:hypothetical protein